MSLRYKDIIRMPLNLSTTRYKKVSDSCVERYNLDMLLRHKVVSNPYGVKRYGALLYASEFMKSQYIIKTTKFLRKLARDAMLKKGDRSINLINSLNRKVDYAIFSAGFTNSVGEASELVTCREIYVYSYLDNATNNFIRTPSALLKPYELVYMGLGSSHLMAKSYWNFYSKISFYAQCRVLKRIYKGILIASYSNLNRVIFLSGVINTERNDNDPLCKLQELINKILDRELERNLFLFPKLLGILDNFSTKESNLYSRILTMINDSNELELKNIYILPSFLTEIGNSEEENPKLDHNSDYTNIVRKAGSFTYPIDSSTGSIALLNSWDMVESHYTQFLNYLSNIITYKSISRKTASRRDKITNNTTSDKFLDHSSRSEFYERNRMATLEASEYVKAVDINEFQNYAKNLAFLSLCKTEGMRKLISSASINGDMNILTTIVERKRMPLHGPALLGHDDNTRSSVSPSTLGFTPVRMTSLSNGQRSAANMTIRGLKGLNY